MRKFADYSSINSSRYFRQLGVDLVAVESTYSQHYPAINVVVHKVHCLSLGFTRTVSINSSFGA